MVLLPDHADFVCLSAIGPNTHELCDWIGRTKRKRVHTISTEKRPVPLQHYLYAAGGMHKVMDRSGKFLSSGHTDAASKLREKEEKKAASSGGYGWGGHGWGGYGGGGAGTAGAAGTPAGAAGAAGTPAGPAGAVGARPRREPPHARRRQRVAVAQPGPGAQEGVAAARDRLLVLEEEVRGVRRHAAQPRPARHRREGGGPPPRDGRRAAAARERDQAAAGRALAETLKRGVGILHEGLIPIMREMVEALFDAGFVRVLFTTEGFAALGVNAPARTVVFNGLRKHDGRGFRDLLAGEYTQMAGRAGRRGHDRVGTVIITCWNDVPPLASLKAILTGPANEFAPALPALVTACSTSRARPASRSRELLKRTFAEFATQRALGARDLPALLEQQSAQLAELERRCEAERCKPGACAAIEEFFS